MIQRTFFKFHARTAGVEQLQQQQQQQQQQQLLLQQQLQLQQQLHQRQQRQRLVEATGESDQGFALLLTLLLCFDDDVVFLMFLHVSDSSFLFSSLCVCVHYCIQRNNSQLCLVFVVCVWCVCICLQYCLFVLPTTKVHIKKETKKALCFLFCFFVLFFST